VRYKTLLKRLLRAGTIAVTNSDQQYKNGKALHGTLSLYQPDAQRTRYHFHAIPAQISNDALLASM